MGRAFEDSGTSQDTEHAVVYSLSCQGWQVGAVGEGIEVEWGPLPLHLFPGGDYICPPCGPFTGSVVSVNGPEGGDISPLYLLPS